MMAPQRGAANTDIDDGHWQRLASCSAYPAQVFFPERGSRDGQRRRIEAAKRICRACPVLMRCRAYALQRPEHYGVWGAMTASERAQLLANHAAVDGVTDSSV